MTPSAVSVLPTTNVTEHDPVTPEQYQMALDNVGLIGFCIERFKVQVNDNYTAEDAFQDGWFGLVRACQKFQPERGHKFSTYAVVRIRSAMQKGRGHHEGTNYRRDIRVGAEHVRALSIDVDDESTEAIRDRLAGVADTEAAAVNTISLDLMRRHAAARCADEVDQAIVEALFDVDYGKNLRELGDEIAERFGVSVPMVRRRIRRLKASVITYSTRSGLVAA